MIFVYFLSFSDTRVIKIVHFDMFQCLDMYEKLAHDATFGNLLLLFFIVVDFCEYENNRKGEKKRKTYTKIGDSVQQVPIRT